MPFAPIAAARGATSTARSLLRLRREAAAIAGGRNNLRGAIATSDGKPETTVECP